MTDDAFKPKILIADDDASTIILLRASVSQWGFSVTEAPDGEKALSMLKDNSPPGIVIIDWIMPHLDGISFCEIVNKDIRPKPYLILLTHNKGANSLVRAIEAGADEYIEKPINLEELRCRLVVATRILTDQYLKLNPLNYKR
jgi:DNA-binding response OmpR family regulator